MGRKRNEYLRDFYYYDSENIISTCKTCGLKLTGSYSTNLRRHMIRKHPELFKVQVETIIEPESNPVNDGGQNGTVKSNITKIVLMQKNDANSPVQKLKELDVTKNITNTFVTIKPKAVSEICNVNEQSQQEGHQAESSQMATRNSDDVIVISKPTPKQCETTNIKIKDVSSIFENVHSLNTSIENVKSTEDEFNIFGQSVAIQLKKLPLAQAIFVQNEIQTLLTRYRLSHIDNTRIIRPTCNNTLSNHLYNSHENVRAATTNVYQGDDQLDIKAGEIILGLNDNAINRLDVNDCRPL